MPIKVEYDLSPVPTIRDFMKDDAFIRALMGPFGSGKSSGCVMEIVQRALAQKPGPDGIARTRWAAIRNTYMQLNDTTIKTFHQWFPPGVWGNWRVMDHRFLINAFPKVEIEVLFRALDRPDQVSNLLSMELTGAWVNEAREVPWAIVEALQGRVGRYPAQRDGGPTWHGIIMDTNPPDVDSRWYRYFEEPDRETGEKLDPTIGRLFKQPSGLSPVAENLKNLPGGVRYYTTMAQGKDQEWVKVYIHGMYGFVIDGKPVFPEYFDKVHCREVTPNHLCPVYRGWDFGLTPACVMTQLLPTGQLIVFDEMTSESMGIERFSDEVLTHCSVNYPRIGEWIDIGDPSGEVRKDTDENTCFRILHTKGVMIEPGLQTLALRLESVRRAIRNQALKGEPGILVDPRCRTLRKAFQGGYQFRRLRTSAERYTAMPDKNMYSHVMDALEYVCTRMFGGGLTQNQPKGWEGDTGAQEFDRMDRNSVTGY